MALNTVHATGGESKQRNKSLDPAATFRQHLVDTVLSSTGLRQRIFLLSITWVETCFSAVFKFHPRVSKDDSTLSAHSSLLFWVTHLFQALTIKANRLPRHLSGQVFGHDHFVWEVPGKGYVLLEPSGVLSPSGARPHWTLSFMPMDNPRMSWRAEQLRRSSSTLSMLSSFEFDRSSGAVKRQPSEQDYRLAVAEVRILLRSAGLLA